MAKRPRNSGKEWSRSEVLRLRREAKGNTPTPLIAWRHGRSEAAIRSKAGEEKISLNPPNRSPYGRRK
jgi:hypothetical protein